MKFAGALLASALVAGSVSASSLNGADLQAVFNAIDSVDYNRLASDVVHGVDNIIVNGRKNVLDGAKKLASEAGQTMHRILKDGALRDFIKQQGITCLYFQR